jgi:hypothetical protein
MSSPALFVLLALVFLSPSLWAAELNGFGPVKFGMTKEEAMAALDEEHEGSGYVRYDLALNDERWVFKVIQDFDDGRATSAYLRDDFDWRSEPNRWILETGWLTIFNVAACQAMVDRLVSIIRETHDVEPLSQLSLTMDWPEKGQDPDDLSELYTFAFDNQAYIQLAWEPKGRIGDTGCGVGIDYDPPLGHLIPF